MTDRRSPDPNWARTDAALDELLLVPFAERAAAVARLSAGDAAFAAELTSLVGLLDGSGGLLDQAATTMLRGTMTIATGVAEGTRLGPWRIIGLIGRGGMGEVYRAERADGQFEQRVAVKLLRLEGAGYLTRFRVERQILASLDHPFIARLLDGDVTVDGRPYMVMELVDGRTVVEWCKENDASLERRLALFCDICDAVAYAHRNLVVHRDLKPTNVLVRVDGRPKLLDFGIARLLDSPAAGDPTRELVLTPGYAPPEQLVGGRVTTASDIYSLGLLLHELLCGEPAFSVKHLPLPAAIHAVLTQPPPLPSRVARMSSSPPVPAVRLSGDLDAIVGKAVRAEPEQRYISVDELRADVERHQHNLPVAARRGNWSYVAGRALRRHRAWALAGSLAALALAGGTAAIAWQARVARDEAMRATAVRDFLIRVFKASDPRTASDTPRGQTTARELLDAGAARIDDEFKSQPALQLDLLGLVSTLYRELGETERYRALQSRRLAVARQYPGRYTADEVEVLINLTDDDDADGERASARVRLAEADALLTRAGLDDTLLRARWWVARGQSFNPADIAARKAAYVRALGLFDKYGPHSPGRVTALSEMGLVHYDSGDDEAAIRWYRDALAAEATTIDRDDAETQTILGNIASANMDLGRYDEAAAAGLQAAEIARRTYGEHHPDYWAPAANYARLLHLNGHREEAMARFEALRRLIPNTPDTEDSWEFTATYVDCLVAEGDAARALPLAESAERVFLVKPHAPNSVRRIRLRLGDAYEQLGRIDDARRTFSAAYDEFAKVESPERQTRMAATERWARFLVANGDAAMARPLFAEVLAQDHGRHYAHAALARAGLARVSLAEGDVAAALRDSHAALVDWASVRGFRDVRMGVYLRRVEARVLLASGDVTGARTAAAAALTDGLHFDVSAARSIAEARELLRQAQGKPSASAEAR